MTVFLFCVGSYLVGSVPFGLLIVFMVRRVDVRTFGSGNIGATNVNRVLGKKYALLVWFFDALKGFVPFTVAWAVGFSEYQVAAAGFAAVIGHCFPVFLRFRGGKGVATALGVCAAMNGWLAASLLIIWMGVMGVSRISAIASLSTTLCLPIGTVLFSRHPAYVIMAVCIAVLIIIRHHENIRTLWNRPRSR